MIDPTGGLAHLRRGVLHTVTADPDQVLKDDGLRILRAARFQAELDLEPTEALLESLTRYAPLLRDIARERLREELERIRRRGVSLEQDELAMGVSSIAAPFFDAAHRLYATVSLTGISAAFSQERGQLLDAILELRDTAQAQCQLG